MKYRLTMDTIYELHRQANPDVDDIYLVRLLGWMMPGDIIEYEVEI